MVPVTRFGLGTAALGRPAYINIGHEDDFPNGRTLEALEIQTHAVLDAAFEAGIRYIDTARSYGDAEPFVRAWLDSRKIPKGQVTVGSKWGYIYEANFKVDVPVHERKVHTLAMLRRQSVESLAILGDWLELYQIHSATLESGVLEDDGVLDELAHLRDRGLKIGVTTSGPAQSGVVRRAIEIQRGGARLFSSVQSTYNVLEPSTEPALRDAHGEGLTVIVKEALANGRLSPRGDVGQKASMIAIAAAHGVTVDAVALAAVLAMPWADRVLLGPSTPAQLASNLRAREVSLGPADLESLRSFAVPAPQYWQDRSGLAWN